MTRSDRQTNEQKPAGTRDGSDRDENGSADSGGSGKRAQSGTSPAEWAVAAASSMLVLGAMGYMLFEALTDSSTPPAIVVEAGSVTRIPSGYVVQFRARNHGQQTAQELRVEGTLRGDSGTVETASATIDFVPAEAVREGGLFFSADPRRYQLTIEPKGYSKP